jgi:hypothetical protein
MSATGWGLATSGPVNSQSTAWAIQGLLAACVNPSSVRRGGRSGLDYLSARRASNGHFLYSSSSDQTPVWVTGQVLVAARLKPFPLAPVPRAARPRGVALMQARAAAELRAGVARLEVERVVRCPSRRVLPASEASGMDSRRAARRARPGEEGPAPRHRWERGPAPPHAQQRWGRRQPATNTAFAADQGDDGAGRRWCHFAIALGTGGLMLGGAWWAARGLTSPAHGVATARQIPLRHGCRDCDSDPPAHKAFGPSPCRARRSTGCSGWPAGRPTITSRAPCASASSGRASWSG